MTIRRIYLLTGSIGIIGFVWYFALQGARSALAFAFGTAISFGNLWLFDWLSRAIAVSGDARKRWQGSLFVGRYLILFTFGYVIVKALGVNPLALLLGLLASTAAVIVSIIVELFESLLGKRRIN